MSDFNRYLRHEWDKIAVVARGRSLKCGFNLEIYKVRKSETKIALSKEDFNNSDFLVKNVIRNN